jgi:hypothetical protein
MSFNNGPRTVVTGLSLLVDAADPLSYPGSGTSWTDIVTGITGSLSGSITYASDFKGTLVVNNSSSVIIFPTSSGNFGTDSFTVELAFQPNQINGQHWLISKNSGSLPTWGAFITGSGGSGRITAFFNVSSTISCSMSTPIGSIVTGSNYLVDINYIPYVGINNIYINSEVSASVLPNGSGSLTTTSSLFISNRNSGSSVGTPLEIFNTKLYTPRLIPSMIRQNYNALSTRLNLPTKPFLPNIISDQLLNLYPGASAAYSLRLTNINYSGFAIRVRRSSDNTEQDIGLVGVNLDTTSLLSFCGGSDGFVTTWYDQSGNFRNATQTNATAQPKIVSGSNVITYNSKPALQFDNTNDGFTTSVSIIKPFSIFVVGLEYLFGGNRRMLQSANLNSLISITRGSATVYTTGNIVSNAWGVVNTQYVMSLINNNAESKFYGNGVDKTNSYNNSDWGTLSFGSSGLNSGEPANALVFETIVYPTDQSTNRTAIESNINSYYQIF